MVTICDDVIITISGTVQLSGTAQIKMNNCSEIDILGSFTCSSNNAFIYSGDSTCDARITIHGASSLCASLTNNSYIQFCNLNSSPISGSTGAATVGCGLSLPIELIEFSAANQKENQVLLEWSTVSEINNDFFTIERSKNTVSWEQIAIINGAGNSNQLLHYNLVDDQPYFNISYYRLKQTDFDGNYTYSTIKAININSSKSDIQIYPNPTNGQITIQGDKEELQNLKIYNSLGQDLTKLAEVISINQTSKTLDLRGLPQGIYTIKTKTTANTVYRK